jgi:hypothetical protein
LKQERIQSVAVVFGCKPQEIDFFTDFLKFEADRSVHVDINNGAYQTYQQHKQKLYAIGRKYSEALDAVKKKDHCRRQQLIQIPFQSAGIW